MALQDETIHQAISVIEKAIATAAPATKDASGIRALAEAVLDCAKARERLTQSEDMHVGTSRLGRLLDFAEPFVKETLDEMRADRVKMKTDRAALDLEMARLQAEAASFPAPSATPPVVAPVTTPATSPPAKKGN